MLAAKRLGLEHLGIERPHAVDDDGDPGLQFADEGFFADARRRIKRLTGQRRVVKPGYV